MGKIKKVADLLAGAGLAGTAALAPQDAEAGAVKSMVYALNSTDPAKLAEVVEKMKSLGPPAIRAAWEGDHWKAIEGSHRIAAAQQLGYPVKIQEVNYNDIISDHDLYDLSDPTTVEDILLNGSDWNSAAYNVERGNATPAMLGATAAATATGMALNQDVQDAHNAVNHFAERRASKQDYWKQKRQEVLDMANSLTEGAFTALDMPLRGYMGLSGVAGALASGGGFDNAMQQGAINASRPTDETAYQWGGAVTDTLSPYLPAPIAAGAGALINAGVLLGSPL